MMSVTMGMSLRAASIRYSIPRSTLQRYIKEGVPLASLRRLQNDVKTEDVFFSN